MKHRLLNSEPGTAAGGGGAGTGTAPGAGAGTGAASPWYGDAHKSLVETKGWKSADDVLTSYTNLEKLPGMISAGRTVVLPKDANDAEGIKAFNAKMGVPESADGYDLPLPAGDNGEFSKIAAGWFHKAGVPKGRAQEIAKAWNEHIAGLVAADEQAAQQQSARELEALKGEWGADFEKRSEFGRRGFQHYGKAAGLEDKDLTAMEGAIGTAKMLKLFHALGETTGESNFAGTNGGGGGGFNGGAAAAQQKMDELRQQRIEGKISAAEYMTQMERLGNQAHPGTRAA